MKPVLVGMNNPLNSDPKYALYPHPPGCTGHRIWEMLNERCGAFRHDYVHAFDRRNVVSLQKFDRKLARRGAEELAPRLAGRAVVLLGRDTVEAFDLDAALPPLVWQTGGGGLLPHPTDCWDRWCRMPHPSGRNHWFNDKVNRFAAGLLLEELYQRLGLPALQQEKVA